MRRKNDTGRMIILRSCIRPKPTSTDNTQAQCKCQLILYVLVMLVSCTTSPCSLRLLFCVPLAL